MKYIGFPKIIARNHLCLIAAAIFCISTQCPADDSERLGAMGAKAFRQKNYEQAIHYFSQAAEVNSNYVGAYYYRGLSYLAITQYNNAIADLSRALALNTNDFDAHYFRGLCYVKEKQYGRAVADLDAALSVKTNVLYLLCRAYANLQMTNDNGSIEDYNRVIHLDPTSTGAYLGRAQAYSREKVFGLAIVDCNIALMIKPNLPEAYQERGDVYHAAGDYNNAISDYDTSLRLAPNDTSGYYLKAVAYSDMGDFSNAIMNLTAFIKFNPGDSEAYSYRGWCRTETGDYEDALSDCQKAVTLDPKFIYGYNNLAWLMAVCPDPRFRNGRKALEYAQKACALGGWQDASCVDTLAAAYAETGDFRKAVKWEKEAIKNIPPEDLAECRKELAGYEHGLPYRETPKPMQKSINASGPPPGSPGQ
jgi:tetratricopeptide (TPR) repeat protein